MAGELGRSNTLLPRVPWRASLNEEESRAYLQSRLRVLSSLMFWSFIAFLGFMEALYGFYPGLKPAKDPYILLASAAGLILLAVLWRVFLVRRALPIAVLNKIDAIYAGGTGICFALGAYLAPNFEPAPYMCLLFTSLVVLTRAIIIPSSGGRTLAMAIVAFTPYMFTGLGLVLDGWKKLPPSAIFGGIVLVGAVVTMLATAGSQTLYGLRQQANVATQLGQYTLQHKIGQGGMGMVYLATHVLLRRPTAVKLLRPDQVGADTVDRFEREVQHMSQLTHPNTVAVFDYGRSFDGVFYYAMEYLDGIDLENLVIEYGPLPVDRVVAIVTQICGALHEAHGRGIIHRDVKPANVIVCERGGLYDVAKLLDFGLVKKITADNTADRAAPNFDGQNVLGTPGYLAPEAITNPQQLGPSADLYALGAVAYYLLTGKRVFDGKTAMAVCVEHITKDPVPPSQVSGRPLPAEVEQIVMACLSRSPADRPASAAALARTLHKLAAVGDWDEDRSTQWWAGFRKQPRGSPTAGPITIDVDLAKRIPSIKLSASLPLAPRE